MVQLLREYPVLQPDGVVRITECDIFSESSSLALLRLNQLLLQVMYQAGNSYTPSTDGVTGQLASAAHQYGWQNIQTYVSLLHYQGGTLEGATLLRGSPTGFSEPLPFFRKWTRVPDDYETTTSRCLPRCSSQIL